MAEPITGLTIQRYFSLLLLGGSQKIPLSAAWDAIGGVEPGRASGFVASPGLKMESHIWRSGVRYSNSERLDEIKETKQRVTTYTYDIYGLEIDLPRKPRYTIGIAVPFIRMTADFVAALRKATILGHCDFLRTNLGVVMNAVRAGKDDQGRVRISGLASRFSGDPDIRRIVLGGYDAIHSAVSRS